ncbi:MAG: hypothetical protein J5685_07375 [Clostridiales bacterium]|nr:hypothetical protein [Clostridiales bacterium]
MKYEAECNANDWYEASRAIVKTYGETVAKDWDFKITEKDFDTPIRFTLMMQTECISSFGKDMEIKKLKEEIEELTAEINRLKYGT